MNPRLGEWELERRLDGGGNANVWRARSEDDREAAVKILRYTGRERVARFRQEITALTEFSGHPGVLPILDWNVPARPSQDDPAWFAMPIAEPIEKALGRDPQIDVVVGAMADIASALAWLAERDVAHRDIKPPNLFRYGGRWVVGDFGLVSLPEAPPLTKAGRIAGSRHCVAPEMIRDPVNSDGRPADVYSLAKTLWVLLTGQPFPPPGHQRIEEPSHQVTPYVSGQTVEPLEFLIDQATRPDPTKRPIMEEMTAQLKAWTTLKSRESAPIDLGSAAKDLAVALEPARRERDAGHARDQLIHGITLRLWQGLSEIAEELAKEGLEVRQERNGADFALSYAKRRLIGRGRRLTGGSYIAVGASVDRPAGAGRPSKFFVFLCTGVIEIDTGEVLIGAAPLLGPSVEQGAAFLDEDWRMAAPGSVIERVDEIDLIDSLKNKLPEALKLLTVHLRKYGLSN